MKQPISGVKDKVPCVCSQRWMMCYIAFLGAICVYLVRVNASIAMVCMVKTSSNISQSNETLRNNSELSQSSCVQESQSQRILNQNGEFEWDKSVQSSILSSFFYGYMVTQIPGGWLADRFGGRRVIGYTMLISGLLTMLIPWCARNFLPMLYVLRALIGLLTGGSFPAFHSMWGRWAPPFERSKLLALNYSGANVGSVIILMAGGVLCEYGFDNGWASIFYLSGAVTLVWVFVWFIVVRDTPAQCKNITQVEKEYILSNLEYNPRIRTPSIPWRDICKSKAVWATIIANFTSNWTMYTLMTTLPTFMKEVLKFNIKQNGFLSSVPYVSNIIFQNVAAHSADFLRLKKILNTTQTRKLYQTLSFVGAGICMVSIGYIGCEHRYVAVVTLTLAMGFMGLNKGGYFVNHVDFAPKYAGVLLGLTNGIGTIPGILTPIVTSAMTPNRSQEEWRNVFFVCGGLLCFGCLTFIMMASGDIQPWSRDKDDKQMEDELFIEKP